MPVPHALHTEQFALYTEAIQMLYQVDGDFKTLCDDYCSTKLDIDKFRNRAKESSMREIEYRNLALELEKEIIEYVTRLT